MHVYCVCLYVMYVYISTYDRDPDKVMNEIANYLSPRKPLWDYEGAFDPHLKISRVKKRQLLIVFIILWKLLPMLRNTLLLLMYMHNIGKEKNLLMNDECIDALLSG